MPSSALPGCICRATRAAARWAVKSWTSQKLRAQTSCTKPRASSLRARPTPRSSSAPPAPITAPRAAASASGPCSALRSKCGPQRQAVLSCWRRGTPTRPCSTRRLCWTSTSSGSGLRRTPPGRSAPALWSRRHSLLRWTSCPPRAARPSASTSPARTIWASCRMSRGCRRSATPTACPFWWTTLTAPISTF